MKEPASSAFSLVEVTLALGIAAFCLIAVFGLVPVGVQTNRNATSQTAVTNILSSVVSDIRDSPPGQGPSKQYVISRTKGSTTAVCFDGQGVSTTFYGTNAVCPANSRYRLTVQIAKNPDLTTPGYPNYAYLKLTWPAAVNPLTSTIIPSGSVGTVTTYLLFP
jgi:uncharacterized protein (TIGR02598 family)